MNERWMAGWQARLALAAVLVCSALPLAAQTGPITTQSLFFNQATNSHQGNYLEAQAGLIYTDNVSLTPDGRSDTLAMIGLVGDTSRQDAPRFDYHLDADIAMVKYFKNEYETLPYGYLDAAGEFKIVPGYLSWVARDSFNQATLDPFLPATPDNLENINYFTTGPRLTLRPTLRTTIIIEGTVSWVDTNSKSIDYINIDNRRSGGSGKIERAFSNTLSAYVGASYSDVKFKDKVNNTDFDGWTYVGGFHFGDSRTYLDASGGYTDLDVGSERASGVNWEVSLSRLISPMQRITLRTLKQFTDAANLFRINLDQPVPGNQPNQIVTGQPFSHEEYGANYRLQGQRTSLEINLGAFTEHYEESPDLNRDARYISAFVSRKMSLVMSLDLGVNYEHDEYAVGGAVHTINVLASLRWQLGPRVALRFIAAHSSLSSSDAQENQIGVTASYALSQAAQAPDLGLPAMRPTSPAMQPRL